MSDLLSRGVPSPVHQESFDLIWFRTPRLWVVPRTDENPDLTLARELYKGTSQLIDTRWPVSDQAGRSTAVRDLAERYVVLQTQLQDLPAKAVIGHGGKRDPGIRTCR